MTDNKQKLKILLDDTDSIRSLPMGVRDDLVNKLLALSDEQMLAIIAILEEEKDKVSAIKAKLKEYGNTINDLFMKARVAGRELKMAFTKAKERDQAGVEADGILGKL
jgi:NRPS condensation-like uncharacterized protein